MTLTLTEYFFVVSILLFFACIWMYRTYRVIVQMVLRFFVPIVVLILSYSVADTYFSAKDEVYHNVNHNSFCFDGYELKREGVLYGASDEALLPDSLASGQMTYQLHYTDPADTMVSRIDINTRSIDIGFFVLDSIDHETYFNQNNCMHTMSLTQEADAVRHSIDFETEDANTPIRLNLQIVEKIRSSAPWFWVKKIDNVDYIFTTTLTDGDVLASDTSAFHLPIQKGYDLSSLVPVSVLSTIPSGIDGLSLCRDAYRRDDKPIEFCHNRFYIEQTRESSHWRILSSQDPHFQGNEIISITPERDFYLGKRTNNTMVMKFTKDGKLLYSLPIMKPLSNEDYATHMHVSSDYLSMATDNRDYNTFFSGIAPRNAFSFEFKYLREPTQVPFSFQYQSETYGTQDTLSVALPSGQRALFHCADHKAETLFQPSGLWRLLMFICIFTLISLLLSRLPYFDTESYGASNNPLVEVCCWSLLLVFVTTRYLLNWRYATFPPTENITPFEYIRFVRNNEAFEHLNRLPYLLFVFCCIKAFWLYLNGRWESRLRKNSHWIIWIIVIFVSFIEIMSLSTGILRSTRILLPVLSYFILDWLISNREEQIQNNSAPRMSWSTYLISRKHISLYLFVLAYLLIADAGYGILFFFFGYLRYSLIFCEFVLGAVVDYKCKEHFRWLRNLSGNWVNIIYYASLFTLMAGMIYICYQIPSFISLCMDNKSIGLLMLSIVIFVIILLICWMLKPLLQSIVPAYTVTCLVFALLCSMTLNDTIWQKTLSSDGELTHIRYRVKVLVEDWDNILSAESLSDSRKVTRFRQTTENQWILNYYNDNKRSSSDPYFKILPQEKTGALWGAQTSDISLLRFGIAEHGIWYARGLFLLFLVLMLISIIQPVSERDKRMLARRNISVSIAILLFVQALYIWMSVTNRFVFFGQDFPMLSMSSNMTIYYFTGLILLMILLQMPNWNAEAIDIDIPNAKSERDLLRFMHERQYIFGTLCCIACLLVVVLIDGWLITDHNHKKGEAYKLISDKTVKKVVKKQNLILSNYQSLLLGDIQRKINAHILQRPRELGSQLFMQYVINRDTVSSAIIAPQAKRRYPMVTPGTDLYKMLDDFASVRWSRAPLHLVYGHDSTYLQFAVDSSRITHREQQELIMLNQDWADYQINNASLRYNFTEYRISGKKWKRDFTRTLQHIRDSIAGEALSGNLSAFYKNYCSFCLSHLDIVNRYDKDLGNYPGAIWDANSLSAQLPDSSHFAYSLIHAYGKDMVKHNSPSNIVYLKVNPSTGFLEYAVNSNYFDIPYPHKDTWRGDIISEAVFDNDATFHRGDQSFGDRHYDALSLFKVPSDWLPASYKDSRILLRAHAPLTVAGMNGRDVQLSPQAQPGTAESTEIMSALALAGGETVDYRGSRIDLQGQRAYTLAHNVWLNGKRTMIYPHGESLFWIRTYANYLTKKMNNSIDAGQDARYQNLFISLDIDLSCELDNIINNHFNRHKEEVDLAVNYGGVPIQFSAIVATSTGEVWAMPDYISSSDFHIHPNDVDAIANWNKRLSLRPDMSEERSLYGNMNLIVLPYGPGSSLKPITYSAVTSGINLDVASMRLEGIEYENSDNRHRYMYHYAGRAFRRKFQSLINDEPDPQNRDRYDVREYFQRSSNYFNSVFTFLGSFSEEHLASGDVLIPATPNARREQKINEFPIFQIGGRRYRFGQRYEVNGRDRNSLLEHQYVVNFELDSANYDKNVSSWVQPEPSFVDFELRKDTLQIPYDENFKSITLGSRHLVNVTPWHMAQMYSKLFLLDNRMRFSLTREDRVPSSVQFDAHGHDSIQSYLSQLQDARTLFQGMADCLVSPGTARNVNLHRQEGHFYYAKTGTINSGNRIESGLLAVIITNMDMRRVRINNGILVDSNNRPLKFCVIYMAQNQTKKIKGLRSLQTEIANAVIESERFNHFMNH